MQKQSSSTNQTLCPKIGRHAGLAERVLLDEAMGFPIQAESYTVA